jgi:hypothetical protein
MKTNKLTTDLDKIYQDYQDNLYKRAETYRQEVLIPFCDKYDLDFFSGMGSVFFVIREIDYNVDSQDIEADYINCPKLLKSKRFKRAAEDIFYALEYELDANTQFGDFMSDYRREP